MTTTTKWIVGLNMPGYLPDNEPADFDNWNDAKAFLLAELESDAAMYAADIDDDDDDLSAALAIEIVDVESAIERVNALQPNEPFGETVVRVHYFMESVS